MNDDKVIQVGLVLLLLLALAGTVLAVVFPGPITIVCAVFNWFNVLYTGARVL